MNTTTVLKRRLVLKSTVLGMLSVSVPNLMFGKTILPLDETAAPENKKNTRYPAIDESMVAEVVGVSHFNLDRLKVLVNQRPELARATWDWGFGDWETAIGAASHTGRKDIADYLLSMGARPDIFTFAMLGNYAAVKSMIEFTPGIQQIGGPHGISLLQHAKNGALNNPSKQANELIDYLSKLGNADGPVYETAAESEALQYVGDYKYGDSEQDAFTVKVNSRKKLLFGKYKESGGGLLKIGKHTFTYNGAPSVKISFQIENEKVISLTVKEPDLVLLAKKV